MKLLIIDDSADTRESLAACFQKLGQEVVTAASGTAAFVEMIRHRFDVILLDLVMPNMSGSAFFKQATEHYGPLPPVIMITGFDADYPKKLDGVAAVLTKPLDLATVVQTVAEVVAGRKGV